MWAHWALLGNIQAVWALFNKLSTSCHIWPYWPKIAQKCPIVKGAQNWGGGGVITAMITFTFFKGKNCLRGWG